MCRQVHHLANLKANRDVPVITWRIKCRTYGAKNLVFSVFYQHFAPKERPFHLHKYGYTAACRGGLKKYFEPSLSGSVGWGYFNVLSIAAFAKGSITL